MKRLLILAGVAAIGSAQATDFFELEPNDTKAAANAFAGLIAGDTINGLSTGSSTTVAGITSADYFRVGTAAAALGIYRHRMTITTLGTAGHIGTLRGLNQVASLADTMPGIPWDGVVGTAGTTDTGVQTSSTATAIPRMNQWYGFGKAEDVYYRVAGVAATTLEYKATYTMDVITPTDIGVYAPGLITMNWNGQGHTTDTDISVYDSNFDPIPGSSNDDSSAALGGAPIATTSFQSWLARSYAPGTYYLAVSNFQLANNMASPSDDNFRTGTMMDFSGSIMNSSTTIGGNLAFTIADSAATSLTVANTKAAAYDVNWFKFEVVPEPGTFFALGAGLFGLAVARRKRTR